MRQFQSASQDSSCASLSPSTSFSKKDGSASASNPTHSVPELDTVMAREPDLPYRPLHSPSIPQHQLQQQQQQQQPQPHHLHYHHPLQQLGVGGVSVDLVTPPSLSCTTCGSRESVRSERVPRGAGAGGTGGTGGTRIGIGGLPSLGGGPIRQHSQPEQSCPHHHHHHHYHPMHHPTLHHCDSVSSGATSLPPSTSSVSGGGGGGSSSATRGPSQQQISMPGEGIAAIAADSLRINGALRQFKQVRKLIAKKQH